MFLTNFFNDNRLHRTDMPVSISLPTHGALKSILDILYNVYLSPAITLLRKIPTVQQAQEISDRRKLTATKIVPLQSQEKLLMILPSGMKRRYQMSMWVTAAWTLARNQSLTSNTDRRSLQRTCICRFGNKSDNVPTTRVVCILTEF
jgi:hypothetical protein